MEFLEMEKAFPLQGNLQKFSKLSLETIRWHLNVLIKEKVFTRNSYKNILPGPNFLLAIYDEDLTEWLHSKAGALSLSCLQTVHGGGCSISIYEGTVLAIAKSDGSVKVDWNKPCISIRGSKLPPPSIYTKEELRIPVRVGQKVRCAKVLYSDSLILFSAM